MKDRTLVMMVAMLAANLGQAEEETTAGWLAWNLASACRQRTQESGVLSLRGGMGTRFTERTTVAT